LPNNGGDYLSNGASSNFVEDDVISGNLFTGVAAVDFNTIGNWLLFDQIGTDLTGLLSIGNGS
jgi:hypothetical protein